MSASSPSPFVGDDRHAEVEFLLRAFERVQLTGRAEVVTLVGLPGWGKTRIVQEFYRRLAAEHQGDPPYWPPELVDVPDEAARVDFQSLSEQRRRVRHANGFVAPAGATIPWLWLAPSIRPGLGAGSALVVDDLHAELRVHIGPLIDRAAALHASVGSLTQLASALLPVPDVLSVISDGTSALRSVRELIRSQKDVGARAARRVDPAADAVRRADEVSRLVRQVARGGPGFRPLPIVVVLDDAHGLDSVASDLVTGMLGSDVPALVIATTWPDRLDSDAPFCEFVRTSSSSSVVVRTLEPLDEVDLTEVVLAAAPRTSPAVARAVVARAGSNPYALMLVLTSEAVRLATVDGAIQLDPADVAALGSSIEKLLDEHWEALSFESRVVLAAGALIGETLVRGPFADVVADVLPGAGVDEHADPLWIRALAENAELLGFLEHARFELALAKTTRLFTVERRSRILQQAADAVADALPHAGGGLERRVLLALQHELALNGAHVSPRERVAGALELADLARADARNDEAAAVLAAVVDDFIPDSIEDARLLIECLNALAASIRLSGGTRKSSQPVAIRAVELARQWLPENDDVRLLAFANLSRSLRRQSAPDELGEAERIADDLRRMLDASAEHSVEVHRNVRGLQVLIEMSRGRFASAARMAAEQVEFCEEHYGPIARQTTSAMSDLGYSLHRTDLPRAVAVRSERLRRMAERLGNPNHLALAPARSDLAISLLDRGQPGDTDRAIELIDEALRVRTAVFGPRFPKTLATRSAMLRARCRQGLEAEGSGDVERAERIYRELDTESADVLALRSQSEKAGSVALAHQRRGEVLGLLRDPAAVGHLQVALRMQQEELHRDASHYSVRRCARSLRWVLDRLGDHDAALEVRAAYGLSAAELAGPGF